MPGKRAVDTVSGSAASQRSGFHSCASSPQISGSVLARIIATVTVEPFGTVISWMLAPSSPIIGRERGSTVSFLALQKYLSKWLQTQNTHGLHSVDERHWRMTDAIEVSDELHNLEGNEVLQSQGLPDNRIEILETVKLLVVQVPIAVSRCADFFAESILYILMLSEQMENAYKGRRGRIGGGEN